MKLLETKSVNIYRIAETETERNVQQLCCDLSVVTTTTHSEFPIVKNTARGLQESIDHVRNERVLGTYGVFLKYL